MAEQTPRRRFMAYMGLLIAAALLAWAVLRVINTAQDHQQTPATAEAGG